MARIVSGVATSHSPQLSTPPEHWDLLMQDDMEAKSKLVGKDGQPATYDELLERADPSIGRELTMEVWQKRYNACQRAIDAVAEAVLEVNPDVIVAIGDDQNEVLHADNMPAFEIYWGDSMLLSPRDQQRGPKYLEYSAWSYGKYEQTYPVASELGRYLIGGLVERNFDVATSKTIPGGRGIGHAFGFVYERILHSRAIPMVPIMVNTFYAPNQPTASRCYDFGAAIRGVIEDWPEDRRVMVVASGGLSHFVIDPELDQRVLHALQNKDWFALRALPQKLLQSGTSEARNWIAASAVAEDLEMQLIDYIPCYRSPAGTGCAMAFARWD